MPTELPGPLSSHTRKNILTGEVSDGNKSKQSCTNFYLESVSYACWKLINRWHVWCWIGFQRITPRINDFCNNMRMSISLHQMNEFVTNCEWYIGSFYFSVVPAYFKIVFVDWVKLWNSYQDAQNVTVCRRHHTLSFPWKVNPSWAKHLTTATILFGIFCQYLTVLLSTMFRLLTDLLVFCRWLLNYWQQVQVSISMAVRFLCSLF